MDNGDISCSRLAQRASPTVPSTVCTPHSIPTHLIDASRLALLPGRETRHRQARDGFPREPVVVFNTTSVGGRRCGGRELCTLRDDGGSLERSAGPARGERSSIGPWPSFAQTINLHSKWYPQHTITRFDLCSPHTFPLHQGDHLHGGRAQVPHLPRRRARPLLAAVQPLFLQRLP